MQTNATQCNTLQHLSQTAMRVDHFVDGLPDNTHIVRCYFIATGCTLGACVVVCCGVLQCDAVCCSALQCDNIHIEHCHWLQARHLCCSALQYVAVWCSVV